MFHDKTPSPPLGMIAKVIADEEAGRWRGNTPDWPEWIYPAALDTAAEALAARIQATSAAALASVHAAQGGESFTAWLGDGGWRRLLRQRPALLRLLCEHLQDWRGAWGEFVARLRADALRLVATLGAQFPVRRVGMSRSDFHAGGRSVIEVGFSNGVVAFYKPRPVAAEQAVLHIHAAVEARVLGGARRELPAIVAADTHGWMAAAKKWPTGRTLDAQGARALLRRLGVVLGLAHLLKLSDLHGENVLIGPAGPVIVDAETVWHPPSRAATLENLRTGERFAWETSILRTNLIAQRLVFAGKPYGWDGALPAWFLHAQGPPEPPEIARTPRRRVDAPNNPFWDAVAALGRPDWRAWIVAGYRQTLAFARPRRRLLDRLGRSLARLPRRAVQRDTFLYASVLGRSFEDPYLADGWHRAAALEMIWLAGGREEPLRPDERAALEHGDIPLVSAPADPTDDHADAFWAASAASPTTAARRLYAWLASGVPVIREWTDS